MKVFILGDRGMLGQVVFKVFEEAGHAVSTLNSTVRIDLKNIENLFSWIKRSSPDVIVNCVGVIPQKNAFTEKYLMTNAVLPNMLSQYFNDIKIIHPSTDCVFSDEKKSENFNFHKPTDMTNSIDFYGQTKALADKLILYNDKNLVLRTSIIGFTSRSNGVGLLDWFKSEQKECFGYTNHHWNGITTLEWANVALKCLLQDTCGLIQPCMKKPVSKYEILELVNNIFDLQKCLLPKCHDHNSDRTLYPTETVPNLKQQLVQYKEWCCSRKR